MILRQSYNMLRTWLKHFSLLNDQGNRWLRIAYGLSTTRETQIKCMVAFQQSGCFVLESLMQYFCLHMETLSTGQQGGKISFRRFAQLPRTA